MVLISSSSAPRVLSAGVFGMMCLLLAYVVHLYLFGWVEAVGRNGNRGYHKDVGVLEWVDPRIGTYGVTPNGNGESYGDWFKTIMLILDTTLGGMIPSVGMPFGMTRWTPQTRENFISQCPYNDMDQYIHGFQATHQPAIWMGESGQVVLQPGVGEVKPLFVERAHRFSKNDEVSTAYVYEVTMDADAIEADHNLTESIYSPVPGGAQPVPEVVQQGANGRTRQVRDLPRHDTAQSHIPIGRHASTNTIKVAMTASSHVGHMRFDFDHRNFYDEDAYVFIQATRQNWTGHIGIDPEAREVSGSNNQRQDYALGPLKAPSFSGYFVSRFSKPFTSYGISQSSQLEERAIRGNGSELGAYVTFSRSQRIEVRTGVSFVSIDQARKNLDIEAASSASFDQAVVDLKKSWLEKLGRITVQGVNETDSDHDPRTVFYTGLFHALQYPSDFSEPTSAEKGAPRTFYSGYTDSVHTSNDSYYQSWSIWDTFRAEHSLLTILAPERVSSMMRSLVQIYEWAGRLPMWANLVETNIMIGTHVDAVIANALARGFREFDIAKAWEGVKKNAFEPPINDTELLYYDREADTPDEVRAGLTTYITKGHVSNDRWSESGSRTLDYAFDDYAAAVVAEYAGDFHIAVDLHNRSMNYGSIYNAESGFMEAKNDNETWAGREQGWAEGNDWIYTFNVMHDPLGLTELMGGRATMKSKLDEYFNGGHNDHSNEPSHHAPYMYAAIGYPYATQNLTREIAWQNYNATSAGLSGNEDLGQMSAWYIFSALGFYPVNPASSEYVLGSPFFEEITIRLPAGAATGGVGGRENRLTITAPGTLTKPFVKGVTVDGVEITGPTISHYQVITASRIHFEMAGTPQSWGTIAVR